MGMDLDHDVIHFTQNMIYLSNIVMKRIKARINFVINIIESLISKGLPARRHKFVGCVFFVKELGSRGHFNDHSR